MHEGEEMSEAIITEYCSKLFNVRYFVQIAIERLKDTIIYIISTVKPKITAV